MKILVIGDLHFGKRKNDIHFLNKQIDFLVEILDRNDYDAILQMGDLFDNRNSVNLYTLNKVVNVLKHVKKDMYITLGNHDQWKKESGEVNILNILNLVNSKIKIIQDTEEVMFGTDKALLVPYLYNTAKVNEMKTVMRKNKYKFVAGHFDFNEHGGTVNSTTVGFNTFKNNTNMVISGHFHKQIDKTQNGVRVKHVGVPFQLDRSNIGEKSCAWIYDTTENTWERINNNVSIKFIDIDLVNLMKGKSFDVNGNIVSLIVKNSIFNKLGNNSTERNTVLTGIIDNLKQYGPLEINIKPINDNIEQSFDSENASELNVLELTDMNYMVDKFFDIRFSNTDFDKKLIEDSKKMIKELL